MSSDQDPFQFTSLDNIILLTDSYKISHHLQYPDGITHVYSYFESRGGKFPQTLFFGLQYILKRWLCGQVVTKEKIAEAKEICQLHFGQDIFNEEGWNYILEKHNGYLPIQVKAVPEGTVVPVKNVLFTVENTDPKCYWLTNYLETLFVQCWYPMTVSTGSYFQKILLAEYLESTADDFSSLPFMLHDFGFRGASCVEGAGIGDAAHLVNFKGTDTLAGLMFARKYYGCKMAGFSIPATEHSTITTWGKDGEVNGFRNMLEKFPNGIVACVSDSYDIWNACENLWGEELRDLVIERGKRNGKLVIRPDSGDPVAVVLKVLNILGSKFGTVTNKKGFKELPPYLRIIQGDGICYEMLDKILGAMKQEGWSANNLAFGSGGALLQKLDRDTQKCAFKCSSMTNENGLVFNVFKDPITDPGKKSKKGHLTLERQGDGFLTVEEGKGDPAKDLLDVVYENGKLLKYYTFDDVRKQAEIEKLQT
ncbi:nicotinamide phosphoribosyltransferase isoform X2 [Octopus sinensis]|uniref:Nicotinamide phosphoribosyltransferase n=1 Tax=Octopus sinensis TaxID=2607531 RepID=A0A7E6ETC1_9MOLL|nr:nicotinamide phosphoribosyltransferase isoform X2 [Octopus sinensis]